MQSSISKLSYFSGLLWSLLSCNRHCNAAEDIAKLKKTLLCCKKYARCHKHNLTQMHNTAFLSRNISLSLYNTDVPTNTQRRMGTK